MTRGLWRYLECADDIGHESDERAAMRDERQADAERAANAVKCALCGAANAVKCALCGAANAVKCALCGAVIDNGRVMPRPKVMRCPTCGPVCWGCLTLPLLQPGGLTSQAFCGQCGAAVEEAKT